MKRLVIVIAILLCMTTNALALTVNIVWPKSTSTNVVSYRVYQSTKSGVYTYGNIAAVVQAPTVEVTFYNVSNRTPLYWTITAVDDAGRESARSPEVSTKWYIRLRKLYFWSAVWRQ